MCFKYIRFYICASYLCKIFVCLGLGDPCNGDLIKLLLLLGDGVCFASASDWFSSSSLIDGNTIDGPMSDSACTTHYFTQKNTKLIQTNKHPNCVYYHYYYCFCVWVYIALFLIDVLKLRGVAWINILFMLLLYWEQKRWILIALTCIE